MRAGQFTRKALAAVFALTAIILCAGCASGGKWTTSNPSNKFDFNSYFDRRPFMSEMTDGDVPYMAQSFTGTYSDMTKSDGKLKGEIFIAWYDDETGVAEDGYEVQFKLLKNGDTPFAYVSSYEKSYMVYATNSAGQTLSESFVHGEPPTGPIFIPSFMGDGNEFVEFLSAEKDKVDCVITVADSTFSFTINCAGFSEAVESYKSQI